MTVPVGRRAPRSRAAVSLLGSLVAVVALSCTPVATTTTGGTGSTADQSSESNRWSNLTAAASTPESLTATSVWADREIVIAGLDRVTTYDPARRRWRTSAPAPNTWSRDPEGLTAAWDGHEVFVLGSNAVAVGSGEGGPLLESLIQAWNPDTDSWRVVGAFPAGARPTQAVLAGDRLLAWGAHAPVAGYDRGADRWIVLGATGGGPTPNEVGLANAVWTGTTVVATGGFGSVYTLDVSTGEWREIPGRPFEVDYLVWTGSTVLGLGPREGRLAEIDPATDAWHERARGPFENAAHLAVVWAGDRLAVWGGWSFDYGPGSLPPAHRFDGAAWDPSTDAWTPIAAPPDGTDLSAGGFWTGGAIVAWGGKAQDEGTFAGAQLVAGEWRPQPDGD